MLKLSPAPGYVICTPYTVKTKTGAFELPKSDVDPEKAPEYGEIIEIGELTLKDQLRMERLCSSNSKLDINLLADHQFPYKIGDKIAYKKHYYFTLTLGTKQYVAVNFENILLRLEDNE